jgi:hypothetical protein
MGHLTSRLLRTWVGTFALIGGASEANAKMWCAHPLQVHEWGVQVFSAGAGQRVTADAIPPYFYTQAVPSTLVAKPVRALPNDMGDRRLPVLQFYSDDADSGPVPVEIEVGFSQGAASAWYPQVDRRVSAEEANGAGGQAARAALLKLRAERMVPGAQVDRMPVPPSDSSRQLFWDALSLTNPPVNAPTATAIPWVGRLRNSNSLWVNRGAESERFAFYEARTTEQPMVRIEPGPWTWPWRRSVTLHNISPFPVHDVFLIQREGGLVYIFNTPTIPSGATATLVVEEHLVPAAEVDSRTRDVLRKQLVQGPIPSEECVMERDPALPVETAEDHTLKAEALEVLLGVWSERFFNQPGTTLVYRESEKYLDVSMPLSIYTDMYHHIRLHRAGLALVEGLTLP